MSAKRIENPCERSRFDLLTWISGGIMLLDMAWGVAGSLGLDLRRTNEALLALSLTLGFPAYLLDLRTKRVPMFLLGLFLFRWLARCFAGPTPVLCSPLPGSALLIFAFALLQWSKLRERGAHSS